VTGGIAFSAQRQAKNALRKLVQGGMSGRQWVRLRKALQRHRRSEKKGRTE
jgi:hypothetical protein